MVIVRVVGCGAKGQRRSRNLVESTPVRVQICLFKSSSRRGPPSAESVISRDMTGVGTHRGSCVRLRR